MKRLILLLLLVSSACQFSGRSPLSSPTPYLPEDTPTTPGLTTEPPTHPARKATPTPTHVLSRPTRKATVSPTSAVIVSTPTLQSTPSPYEPYTVDFLRSRTYGGGDIEVIETMEEFDTFTRYLIRYPSDGLTIYGFANVPKGEGPFPVIIAIHGFVEPAKYQTLDYTAESLDSIAQEGYVIIHPDLRNYPPSDNGDNLFRVGMAIDILNLIALVKSKAGPPELFDTALVNNIGLWGHSMGGEVALRVLTVSSDIKATLLYASMSGDESKNSQLLFNTYPDPTFQTELAVPSVILERISPMYYYANITSPIQLHHGTADTVVPVSWAEETCSAAVAAGVQIECIYYPDEGHTFRGRVIEQFWNAMIGFYQTYLSP